MNLRKPLSDCYCYSNIHGTCHTYCFQKSALHAEEQFLHGRTKLRHAGKQIRNVIQSAYKIEIRAGGLKDILGELPKRETSLFRSQVSKLASEAKKEKNTMSKEISKISNYGISV
ncbi:hypothetical protein JHK84_031305 [Glycine max]|uniref:Uncharacterized protein n=1 Tax=Glycine soja TaxID=3848 RepID=A0A445I2G8_GLYSO|nr:hypothetical protein JHK85_031727 [Glycine max]KAG5145762.1 hypothetical protein JHK84_031305 [Glycine max]RZB80112.1 hypothetical protein D0Y65_030029 [Glycine soja]